MRILLYLLALLVFFSCVKEPQTTNKMQTGDYIHVQYDHAPKIIPIENAQKTLDDFISENGLVQTKSGKPRKYDTISTYYSKGIVSKSATNVVASELPTAYVVNFEDNEGFAVLGANEAIPDIIAVTEAGQIDPVSLNVINNSDFIESEPMLFEDMDESEIEYFNDNVTITADTLFYCIDDDDYFVGACDVDALTTKMVYQCIQTSYEDYYTGSGSSSNLSSNTGSSSSSSSTSARYNTVNPLLNYSWSQATPYNRYCRRGLLKQKQALTGCSTTALAMIIAYNEYPQTLTINGSNINYTEIKSKKTAISLSETYQNQIALLMGSIYNFVMKLTSSSATLITPKQIQKRMQELGYSNVVKADASSLTSGMISKISQMLGDNKPVFISAIPKGMKNWGGGHSWVVDGAKYSSSNTYLLHMNFGWSGSSNGYFATNCLNPTKAVEFDDPSDIQSSKDYVYNWHFRLITYDTPTSPIDMTIT